MVVPTREFQYTIKIVNPRRFFHKACSFCGIFVRIAVENILPNATIYDILNRNNYLKEKELNQ